MAAGPDRASTPAIEFDGIVKTFGRSTALDGLTLTVGRGELVGLLGPNGRARRRESSCCWFEWRDF